MEINGFQLIPGALDLEVQTRLVDAVMAAAEQAPFYRPQTPGGRAMSVMQTSFGPLGWVTDAGGYRYEARHPVTGRPWPAMPIELNDLWRAFASEARPADSCLINLYRDEAKMGLHQDADEEDFSVPVLSISLGDTAVFRLGGANRRDPTKSFRLSSGDICMLAGPSRRAFHGIDRVLAGSSRLIPGGGRINLTMRRARL